MTLKISKWLFLLLIFSLPLIRPFNTSINGLQVPFTDFIFLLVFFFWLIAFIRGEATFKCDKFYIYIAFYSFALLISTIFSIQPRQSFFKLLGEVYLFSLGVLTFNLVQKDQGFYKQIAIAWLSGTGLTFLASLAGFVLFYLGYKTQADNYFLSHFGSLPAGNYPRIHALFSNANMMCNFLNVSMVFLLLASKQKWLGKILTRSLQTGVWLAAIFTFSAGLGGMILSSGIWFWALLKEKKSTLTAKTVLVLTICAAVSVFAATLISPDTNNTNQDFSVPFAEKRLEVSVRVLVWENALETFKQFPLTGKGTGTNAALVDYQTLSGDRQILLDAHNNWFNILAQTGLLGILSFIALNAFLITKCRFRFNVLNEQNVIHLALSCAFLGAFLYQGLSGSFEDARHLWILFGLLAAISNGFISESDISKASREP